MCFGEGLSSSFVRSGGKLFLVNCRMVVVGVGKVIHIVREVDYDVEDMVMLIMQSHNEQSVYMARNAARNVFVVCSRAAIGAVPGLNPKNVYYSIF